jgi:proteasome lid subunit RPN8/RPN11
VVKGLALPSSIADEVMLHARAELANEECGLLSGSLATGRATQFHRARKAEASPLRYNVHPEDLVRITFAIEDAGEELVAIFHSHTRSAAVPSATDRRTAMYADPFYLLASLADPDAAAARAMRSWRIYRGKAFEVPLTIG